jgi:Cu(I)/Ag(I) efflux system protein CusF
MKRYATAFTLFMVAAPAGWAQSGGMGGMDMKNMDMTGKDKKDNASQKAAQTTRHKGVGTVTAVNTEKGTVTIAHGAIQTLKWPAMSMSFGVKDKALLEKLSTGKKVSFEFVQQGSDNILTSAK